MKRRISVRLGSSASRARSYPGRAVRLVVGFPSGGPVDIAARLVGHWLSGELGQTFHVDNLPGESGNRATREVVLARPDGHTLLVCGPVNTINTTLFPRLGFDFSVDTAAVASLYRVPLVVEVNPSTSIDTPRQFLSVVRSNPGRLRVAYAGVGTPQHLAVELFARMAGADVTLVPYSGSTPALADLVTGRVDAMFDPLPSSVALIRTGRLKAIAITTTSPSPALPDVPTMSSCLPGYEAESWFGVTAPKDTPSSIVSRLNAAINRGLADAAIAARISDLGGTVMATSPSEFATFVLTETERYSALIDRAGVEPD